MNKTGIDWTEYTWNPLTGCKTGCKYCYAVKIADRFSGDVRLNLKRTDLYSKKDGIYILDDAFEGVSNRKVTFPFGFAPTLHRYRLNWPNKIKSPATIFVGSMCDLFGDWVPDWVIETVFEACANAPQHRYMFLTKNPKRYGDLILKGLLPSGDNFWYGSTVTSPDMEIFISDDYKTFVSIEPIMQEFPTKEYAESIGVKWSLSDVDWVIIGAETGIRSGKVIPKREWIDSLAADITSSGVPLFMKESLKKMYKGDVIQEFPDGLKPQIKVVPHCKMCKYCKTKKTDRRGQFAYCERPGEESKHIPGVYSRTSPPWCPKRRKGDEAR